jgi:hypothetical protein
MTSPAAAARRQSALDRIVEDLVEWGCPLAYADERARRVLDRVLAAGYRLPDSIADAPPPPGVHSTAAGRIRAKILFVHHRAPDEIEQGQRGTVRRARCACRHWIGTWDVDEGHQLEDGGHEQHVAAMLVVAGVATATERLNARPQRPAEALGGSE